jgi:hypothetical protein
MSALPPKADIDWSLANVRFVPIATTASFFIEELADRFHRRVRLFFHDPMPGICNDAAFNIGADLPHDCSLLLSK